MSSLLLILLLCCLHLVSGELKIDSVTSIPNSIAPEETSNTLGAKFRLPKRLKIKLECIVSGVEDSGKNLKIEWLENKTRVDDFRFSIADPKPKNADKNQYVSVVTISNVINSDIKPYTCRADSSGKSVEKKVSFSVTKPLVDIKFKDNPNTFDASYNEGEEVQLECVVYGNTGTTVKWKKGSKVLDGEKSFKLVRQSVKADDRDYYTCEVGDGANMNSATAFLRVKDPNSYIVPLVTITVEVVILAIIIVVYEIFMKKKRQAAESKSD